MCLQMGAYCALCDALPVCGEKPAIKLRRAAVPDVAAGEESAVEKFFNFSCRKQEKLKERGYYFVKTK